MSNINFVLDVGNVLISFNPRSYLHSLINNPETESKMFELIFKSPQWDMTDMGVITHEEACSIFSQREPGFKEVIERVMGNLTSMLRPIPETVELLPKIKAAGYKLYYLSNISDDGRRFVLEKYSFFDYFDGGVFSCDVRVMKPSAEIYTLFLEKYRLAAGDCLFFDDMEINVKAAESIGMKGILFTDAQDIERFI